MLETASAPDKPRLSPPSVPEELARGAPPPMEEPRSPLVGEGEKTPRAPLEGSLERSGDDRRERLRPRGELLR